MNGKYKNKAAIDFKENLAALLTVKNSKSPEMNHECQHKAR